MRFSELIVRDEADEKEEVGRNSRRGDAVRLRPDRNWHSWPPGLWDNRRALVFHVAKSDAPK